MAKRDSIVCSAVSPHSSDSLIPAVGYLRRSSDKQEQSLPDQRREITKYAKANGYQLLRWYQDDAISGDDTLRRHGFLDMHAAACGSRDFEAILVWDIDRFGRFHSMEAGYWVHPLMKAGVRLVSVTEGPVNWDDFTGRVVYSLKQEGKYQYLIDLSRNSTRGHITTAQQGYLCGQAAPYGYDRMLVDESGTPQQRVRNGEKVAKPKSWKVTLVPADDPERVRTLQWLFEAYAQQDMGLRSLADALNQQGVAAPRGGLWQAGTIREILRNETYLGTLTYAKRRMGKYHRVVAGDVRARDDFAQAKVKLNAEAEQIRIPNAHPALIEQETWEKVQEKLVARKGRTTPWRQENGDLYLLSGLIHCGHCQKKMYGKSKRKVRGGKSHRCAGYICSTYQRAGHSQGCYYHTVDQDALLAVVLKKLKQQVFGEGHRDELRRRIVKRLAARVTVEPELIRSFESRLAELESGLDRATDRMLRSPDDLVDLLAPKVSRMRQERDGAANRLAGLKRQAHPVDADAEADSVLSRLWSLEQEIQEAEPARLRELIRRIVGRIDLFFDHVPHGKRIKCSLSRGMIELKQDPIFFGLVNREGAR